MFLDYERLKCDRCADEFEGRRPSDNGEVMCPQCIIKDSLPLVKKNQTPSDEMLAEVSDGRGLSNE